jgi:RNA polymerase sigma-70 factor (ECF subfamily)
LPEDPASAEEVVQCALSRALRNIHTYRGEAALFTWLCVICRNELADWARRNARHREHLVLTEDTPEIRQVVEALDAPLQDSPEARYQRAEASRLIQVALDRLPASYGDALEWKYIQGYTVTEIAGRLGLSYEATQSLLARARKSFKEVYAAMTESLFEHPEPGKA